MVAIVFVGLGSLKSISMENHKDVLERENKNLFQIFKDTFFNEVMEVLKAHDIFDFSVKFDEPIFTHDLDIYELLITRGGGLHYKRVDQIGTYTHFFGNNVEPSYIKTRVVVEGLIKAVKSRIAKEVAEIADTLDCINKLEAGNVIHNEISRDLERLGKLDESNASSLKGIDQLNKNIEALNANITTLLLNNKN